MSVETLVLLAVFVVLPLLQQLIRATRQRNQRPPEPMAMSEPPTLARTPPPEVSVPPLPNATRSSPSDGGPPNSPVPASRGGGQVTITATPHRPMGQHAAVGLRTRRDLRRAIVLVATLGPCRASSPYGSACDEWTR